MSDPRTDLIALRIELARDLSGSAERAILFLAEIVDLLTEQNLEKFRKDMEPGNDEAAAFLRGFADLLEFGEVNPQ